MDYKHHLKPCNYVAITLMNTVNLNVKISTKIQENFDFQLNEISSCLESIKVTLAVELQMDTTVDFQKSFQ